jgi:hypothetical protein
MHLNGAASELGCIVDRSEDASSDPGNLTSPGVASRMGNRVGADTSVPVSISDKAIGTAQNLFKAAKGNAAVFETGRTDLVKALYKSAAAETNQARKRELSTLAFELDKLSVEQVQKSKRSAEFSKGDVIGSRGMRKDFWERHAFRQ